MEYKKLFTKEELKEIVEWFESHWDKLPESLYMDKATYLSDFKRTVRLYYDIAKEHSENPTYSGQIFQLFKMRDAVEREWQKPSEG